MLETLNVWLIDLNPVMNQKQCLPCTRFSKSTVPSQIQILGTFQAETSLLHMSASIYYVVKHFQYLGKKLCFFNSSGDISSRDSIVTYLHVLNYMYLLHYQ